MDFGEAKIGLWMYCLDMLAPPLQTAAGSRGPLGHAWLLAAAGTVPTRENGARSSNGQN